MTIPRQPLDALLAELLTLDAVVAACPLLDLDALLAAVDTLPPNLCTVDDDAATPSSTRDRPGTRRRRRTSRCHSHTRARGRPAPSR